MAGEPFRVSFVSGVIEVSGRVTCQEQADELVAAIQALKFLLRSQDAKGRLSDDNGAEGMGER